MSLAFFAPMCKTKINYFSNERNFTMTTLFVNGCLREGSRTLRLAKAYLEKHAEDVKEVKIDELDLLPFNGERLAVREADIAAKNFDKADYDLARDFMNADDIVIAAPLWDGSYPAMLKIYFEHLFVRDLLFYYPDGAAQGLCKADTLTYITTAGGPIFEDNGLEKNLREMMALFGIDNLRFIKADNLDTLGTDVDAVLGDVMATF